MNYSLDLLAIGHPIVDFVAPVEESFLVERALNKGAMALVDEKTALELTSALRPSSVCGGGSAANTAIGLAGMQGRVHFIGKRADDAMGAHYVEDLLAHNVGFSTASLKNGAPTGRCIVLVTPDGERTMSTYLGAAVYIKPEDLPIEQVASTHITYFEGYLWDHAGARETFLKAAQIMRESAGKMSLTLSDFFCVDRHRDDFMALLQNGQVDILFANEAELTSLFQHNDFDRALHEIRELVPLAAITRSDKGSYAVTKEQILHESALKGVTVKDLTGAGDMFAAGFLHAVIQEKDLALALRLGNTLAAHIISVTGARPKVDLLEFSRQDKALTQ